MPRVCTVCQRDDREEIDRALMQPVPIRRIAQDTGLSETALRRHRDNHVAREVARAEQRRAARAQAVAAEVVERGERLGDDLLATLRELTARALAILRDAEADGDRRVALEAIGKARAVLETVARVEGQIQSAPVTNVLVASPEWLALRARILRALQAHPEALDAVRRELGSGD